jgi:predicted DNA-binding antitoxin AbrB/MazE fold protein
MIAVNGVYENGVVRLDRKIRAKKKMKVIVTFLDEEISNEPKRLKIEDFSFLESREKSKRYTGSLSDAVVEERRSDL